MKKIFSLVVIGAFGMIIFSSCIKKFECNFKNEFQEGTSVYEGNNSQEIKEWKQDCVDMGGTWEQL